MNLTKRAITIFSIIVMIVLCFLPSAFAADAPSIANIVEKISPSIVLIVTYDSTGTEIGTGSGFFMDRERRIMTNARVIKNAYSAKVLSESNYYNDVTILGLDKDLDLALIRVKAGKESPLEFDFEYKIKHGERVVAIGRPFGLRKAVLEGLISDVSSFGESLEFIQTTTPMPFFHTSSDGPLLNMNGKVIGVTTSTISNGASIVASIGTTPVFLCVSHNLFFLGLPPFLGLRSRFNIVSNLSKNLSPHNGLPVEVAFLIFSSSLPSSTKLA